METARVFEKACGIEKGKKGERRNKLTRGKHGKGCGRMVL